MLSVSSNSNNNGFSNHGMGCNISVTLSDDSFDSQIMSSPKKSSFFDSILKKNPSSPSLRTKEKSTTNNWTNIFNKKSDPKQDVEVKQQSKQDEEMAKDEEMAMFIEQLQLDGKSEADIKLHLSYIHDVPSIPVPAPASPTKSKGVFSQFLSDLQQVFKDMSFEDVEPYPYPEEYKEMTVSISTAPFFGAFPPNTDMTCEELASLEPVYVGSRCINNLPSCVHNGEPLPGDQSKCPVCLSDFAEGETLKSLPCIHFYHKDCIDSWLMVGHTCPMCKTLVE
jgi:hypothetical protein